VIVADRPFRTLLTREVLRFTRIWVQTLIPSLLTSLLYLVVFGLALGARIKQIEGIPYLEYILPGVALMNLVTGSQMNSSWSVFDAKRERYIDEVLIAPMSDLQIALAYSLGGTLRGVVMGAGVLLVGALGTMVGALATRVEHISFLANVVIQPLAFLGGVFYSVGMLPEALRMATLFNPIFYTVDAARYATLEVSDLNPYPTVAVVFLLAVLAFCGAWWAIHRGPNLRY
jgi:ABC-2 type transport system permease protein